ncbi:uncharacterized protein LOC144782917 [Lissotriton helveticus]
MASEKISTIEGRREQLENVDERLEVLQMRIINLTELIKDEEEHASSVRKEYTLAEAGIAALQEQLNSLEDEQQKLTNATMLANKTREGFGLAVFGCLRAKKDGD